MTKMRTLIITLIFCFISICVFGQVSSTTKNDRGKKLIIIHKQYGDTITESELYHYMGIKYSLYTFKISGDTVFKYLDEDPPKVTQAFIDSLSNGTLERSANLYQIKDINGDIYNKRDIDNHIIVLNFWATWCSPCIEELPELNKLVEYYQNKNVLFFAPTLENEQSLGAFLSNREFKYKVVPSANEISSSFNTYALPTHVIINQNGIVKFIKVGTDTETIFEVLSNEIEKHLLSENSL